MKRALTLVATLVCLAGNSQVRGEWTPRVRMAQSLNSCFNAADRFLSQTNYGYAPQISLVGTYMDPGNSYPMLKNFAANTDYIIIAAGDQDATDVNLRVVNSQGRVLAEDTDASPLAIVEFNAGNGGQYRIEAILQASAAPAFVSFVILQKGGWFIPRREFDIAKETMFRMCEGGNEAARNHGMFLRFNDGRHQATLFGGLLGGEQGTMLTNLNFGTGDIMIVAAGDSDVEDIDLILYDNNNRELTADRLPNAHPVITWTTDASENYKVKVTSEAARDSIPTYCIIGLLQVRQ